MKITVEVSIIANAQKVWEIFTAPSHIMQWNAASDDWCCPAAMNDLRVGGSFSYTMAARDGSFSFEFEGTYDVVIPASQIGYVLGDSRRVDISFSEHNGLTVVTESFDADPENSEELQRGGWQAILDRFKRHVELQLA